MSADSQQITGHQCLAEHRLRAYLQGQLPPAEIEQVSVQTEACQLCQQTMEQLESEGDVLLETIRDRESTPNWEDSPELADLLAVAELAQAESRSHTGAEKRGNENELPLKSPQRVGQYLLLQPLGHGGMGTVWRAEHVELRRMVALKMLSENRPHTASARARFRREMQAIGRLQHPNVVQALDAGEADGRLFLAMELLPGVDAAQRVRESGPLSVTNACEIIQQAARGIDYAHQQGLLHRDVKPSNLMLLPDGTVKVLDLGLARFAIPDEEAGSSLTSESHVLGTGDFVAPEQGLDARAADERSDIYSLGGTLYFLLTGTAPFASPERDTFAKKVMAHVNEPSPQVTAQREDLPAALEKTLQTAMAKLPADRFASAASFAAALQPFCQPVSTSEANAVAPASGAKRTSLAPWIASVATALLMLILFAIALAAAPKWMLVGKVSGDGQEHSDPNPPIAPRFDGAPPPGEVDDATAVEGNINPLENNSEQDNAANVGGVERPRKPVHLEWIFAEHEGRKRDPSGMLIHGQGFCFLSGVQGKFHGWADKVHVDVNKDNVWGVSGAGVEFNVDVKARAFSVEMRQPRALSVEVNAYRWSPPSHGVRMLHKDEGVCVLTSFVGGLKADDEFAGVELGEDGYYWLRGKSQDTTSTALATSVLLSRERTLATKATTYRWPSEMHRQPIRMIHSGEGICFLSLIRGRYATPEDMARVYIDEEDGFWYLSGGGPESPVSAEAIAIQFEGTIVE